MTKHWNYKKYSKSIAGNKRTASDDWLAMEGEISCALRKLAYTESAYELVGIAHDETMLADDEMTAMGKRILALAKAVTEAVANDSCEKEELENITGQAMALRSELKDHMDCLVTYLDRFSVYSHILQSMYYQFNEMPEMSVYDDQEFAKKVVSFLKAEQDQTMLKLLMMDILRALPVRMTKSKFFELVSDGLSVYIGSDRSAADDFLYQLRNAAGLYEPAHFDQYFPEIYSYLKQFEALSYADISQEDYDKLVHTMQECLDYVNTVMESYNTLTTLTNELAVICMTAGQNEVDQDIAYARHILNYTLEQFTYEDTVDVIEPLLGALEALEGVQEPLAEELYEMSAALENVRQSKYYGQMDQEQKDRLQQLLDMCDMMSSNNYSQLGEVKETQTADQAYVLQQFAGLKEELTSLFQGKEKAVIRGIMSAVIGYLPSHFANVNDLEQHILFCLNGCTNMPEKMACIDQIEAIMSEDGT